MSFEIVYTSSQRGLNGGSRGFCTVAATTGIPRLLQEKLESLSGYRHLHSPGSQQNAVNYSYQIVRVQQESYFVLSRVADAGTDFSARSNKIAHHLALSVDEVRAAGAPPATLLADRSFWYTKWSGEPDWLPTGRMPAPVTSGEMLSATWQNTFGDAGWAGVVARSVANDFEPVFVIVPPGCNALGLVNEAVNLVPRRSQWKVSFSTYFTRTSGGECHWRFLQEGTDEATAVRNRPMGIVIDSKSRIDQVADDAYVAAARTGGFTGDQGQPDAENTDDGESFERRPVTQSQLRRRQAGARARQARLAPKSRPEPRREREVAPPPHAATKTGSDRKMWWIVAGVTAFVILSAFVMWFFLSD